MRARQFLRQRLWAAAIISLLAVPSRAPATLYTWTGGGPDDNWSTAANWSGGAAPTNNETGVELVFPALTGAYTSNNDRSGLHVASLSVTTAVAPGDYSFTGNAIGISGTMTTSNPATGSPNLLWQIPLVLEGDLSVVSSGRQTRLQGPIDLGAFTLTFAADLGDVLVTGEIGGDGNLVKTGNSALTLSGANTYAGTTTAEDGALYIDSATAFGGDVAGTTFTGGELGLQGPPFTTSEPIDFVTGGIIAYGDHTLSGPLSIDAPLRVSTFEPATVLTLAGAITGAGGLTKDGPGLLILDGVAKAYAGATRVAAGTLRLDGDLETSDVAVDNGATLRGNAIVGGAIVVHDGGTVSPGSSPGALACSELTLEDGADFVVEIVGPQPVSQYDRLQVESGVTLGGPTLDVSLSYAPIAGEEFAIITQSTPQAVEGTFAGLGEGAVFDVSGTSFGITYRGGSSGNDVVLVAGATAVPTPTVTPPATATQTAVATATPTATGTTAPSTATATASRTGTSVATATGTQPAAGTPTATPTGPTPTATPAAAVCVGDCDHDGTVSISELILGVNIVLDNAPVSACPSFDPDGTGQVTIAELIQGVANALAGCP